MKRYWEHGAREPARPAARAGVPPALRRPHDLDGGQRDGAGRARVRRARPDGLDDRPRASCSPRGRSPSIVLLLFGGVWADRLPRHHVMVASNLVERRQPGGRRGAAAHAGTRRSGSSPLLAAVNGASSAFFFPASTGSSRRRCTAPLLQQANATLRLALNATNITGAAIGGILVAATSPGSAIAIDAVSYGFAAAAASPRCGSPRPTRMPGSTVLHELREGWHDFWSRTWLWAIVLQFGIVNAFESGASACSGRGREGRTSAAPAAWGAVLTATSVGLVLCGVLMLRWRPRRILSIATLAVFPLALPLLALAGPAPLRRRDRRARSSPGFGIEIFGVLWDTTMQQEIPQEKLSRLSSYDALGSLGADADRARGRSGRSPRRSARARR